ncbi:hypothetical protein BC834DRAFT_549311 [Gloeopeniophorella convolvens]|nr:hypothetical protein BC834DRAFT_549311 [Gloeopeniophorella convolvens]
MWMAGTGRIRAHDHTARALSRRSRLSPYWQLPYPIPGTYLGTYPPRPLRPASRTTYRGIPNRSARSASSMLPLTAPHPDLRAAARFSLGLLLGFSGSGSFSPCLCLFNSITSLRCFSDMPALSRAMRGVVTSESYQWQRCGFCRRSDLRSSHEVRKKQQYMRPGDSTG